MEKRKFFNNQPTLFILVKFFLVLNLACAGFMIILFTCGICSSAVSHSFKNSERILDVRKAEPYTTRQSLPDSVTYRFTTSKSGDLAVMMPWYSSLFIPLGFINIPVFEMSLPYWVFYFILCFLLYRIISSLSIESPFSERNTKRIFWIGYALIFYDVFAVIRFSILSAFVEKTTTQLFRYDGLGPLIYFKVGILIIILAMIYRRGVAMQREQELTI
jgi:hypothetical protein